MADVREATTADVATIAKTLARAFVSDPVAAYIFPGASRRESRLRRFFALQLRHNYLRRGEVYTVPDGSASGCSAAALWLPPDPAGLGPVHAIAHAPLIPLLAGIGTFASTRRLSLMLVTHHPRIPHYYLGTIGTDPALQGRGAGSALLAHVLDRCDAERLPAYLECSKLENVAFYADHGFVVSQQVVAPGMGPKLWLMWREPTVSS